MADDAAKAAAAAAKAASQLAKEAAAAEARRTYTPLVLKEAYFLDQDNVTEFDSDVSRTDRVSFGDLKARVDYAFLVNDHARVISLVDSWVASSRPSGATLRDMSEAACRSSFKLGRHADALRYLDLGGARLSTHPSQLLRVRILRALGRHLDAFDALRGFLEGEPLHVVGWTMMGDLIHEEAPHVGALASFCWSSAVVYALYQKRDLDATAMGRRRSERDEAVLERRLAALPEEGRRLTTGEQVRAYAAEVADAGEWRAALAWFATLNVMSAEEMAAMRAKEAKEIMFKAEN